MQRLSPRMGLSTSVILLVILSAWGPGSIKLRLSPEDYASHIPYGTFIGGTKDEGVCDIALDEDGNIYVAGLTQSPDFPVTPGGFDNSYNGGGDIFVAKLNPTGSDLIYATFIGGKNLDLCRGIALDKEGSVYITGYTESRDFPTTPGAYSRTYHGGGNEIFVAKLDSTGSRLVYSTFLGGSEYEYSEDVAVDKAGNAYITGSAWSLDFPTTFNAFDREFKGGGVFVAKLNSIGSQLIFSTFLGGTLRESASAIAVDEGGNVYVTGYTESSDFPTTPGAYSNTSNGKEEVFITKLNSSGSGLAYSTLLGGSRWEIGTDILIDTAGFAYVVGETGSTDFPATSRFFTSNGGRHIFAVKIDPSGSRLIYGILLAGKGDDAPRKIAIDKSGNVYIAGFTSSTDFPTTVDALKSTHSGGKWDAFVAQINPTGNRLIYSTYLGGNEIDMGRSIVVNSEGEVYVAGETNSPNFPATPGAYKRTFNTSHTDCFLVKIALRDVTPPWQCGLCIPRSKVFIAR